MERIVVTEDNIHIEDGFIFKKREFGGILRWKKLLYPECKVFAHRSIQSMENEWAVHNALYWLGLFRSHTKDVDINWPQSRFMRFAYDICGMIVWPFIR